MEGKIKILLGRGVAVARSITELQNAQSSVMATHFVRKYRQFERGTTINFLEPIAEVSKKFALSDPATSLSITEMSVPTFDIYLALPNDYFAVFVKDTASAIQPLQIHN